MRRSEGQAHVACLHAQLDGVTRSAGLGADQQQLSPRECYAGDVVLRRMLYHGAGDHRGRRIALGQGQVQPGDQFGGGAAGTHAAGFQQHHVLGQSGNLVERGVLLSDGYGAYDAYAKKTGIIHAHCWTHCRREFINAENVEPVLALYLDALHFAAMAEQFGSHALLDVTLDPPRYGRRGRSSTLCIRNVVPAPHLAARHAAAHSSVLFSGTLTPPTFYRDLLGLPAETGWVDVESPFHSGQLAVHTVGHLSTRFADRAQSLAPIAHLMAEQFARLPGNYLCFASSIWLRRGSGSACSCAM